MRLTLICCALLAGCATTPTPLPWQAPATAFAAGFLPATTKRRAQVELVVKSNYDELRRDIRAGGGPVLTKAMDAAGVPERDRPTRVMQLQSDIGTGAGPGVLINALLLYGS